MRENGEFHPYRTVKSSGVFFLEPDGAGTSGTLVFLTVGRGQYVADCRFPLDDLTDIMSGKYSEALRSDIALAHGTVMCATFSSRSRMRSLHLAVNGADLPLFPLWIAYVLEPMLVRARHLLFNIHDTAPYTRLHVARGAGLGYTAPFSTRPRVARAPGPLPIAGEGLPVARAAGQVGGRKRKSARTPAHQRR